ncbi:hypothetical protein K443DRAFT_521010 [Laccaria amethystina LaAM-08-1]|uniref:Uncharacterized protein n=1 Tax=Laccaria amethystina LaAM-08-1 TaxID=1095629 RepID=A0A0C9XXM2_9AGAR|nr:hypothetical protein K443DRAFT_521010 [Laccaria amethystina LaAM-08-1]
MIVDYASSYLISRCQNLNKDSRCPQSIPLNGPCQIYSSLLCGYRELTLQFIPQTFRFSPFDVSFVDRNFSFFFPSIEMLRTCRSAFTNAGISVFSNKQKALG